MARRGGALQETIRWSRRLRQLPRPGDDELVLVVVGETMLVESSYYAAPNATRTLFGICRDADLTLATLSATLADGGAPSSKDVVIAPTAVVDDLAAAGIDVVSLATHHLLDTGPSGLRETLAALGRAGIDHAGGGLNSDEARRAAVQSVRGQSVGFVGFHAALDWSEPRGSTAATEASPGVAPIRLHRVRTARADATARVLAEDADILAMERQIRGTKRQHDAVIVSIDVRWPDNERGGEVPAGIRQLSLAAVDAGAALVVGSGGHWAYPLERYGTGYIAYGLGSFFLNLFENGAPARRYAFFPETHARLVEMLRHDEHFESVLLRAVLRGGTVERVDLVPFGLSRDGNPSLVDDERAGQILRRVVTGSAAHGTELESDRWHAWTKGAEPS